jgi:NADPH:quinone reductase-like Zn-dependent oxidoreductase
VKAIRYDGYGEPGEVLTLRDVTPPEVGEDGIVVRVRAAALNPADWHLVTGVPRIARAQLGLRRPRVCGLGADLAGQVEAVGPAVTTFRAGDEVYGSVDRVPGTSVPDLGSVAELVRVAADSVRPVPARLTPVEAAAVPLAATTALRGLRDVARLRAGQHVLINGASGGVGTFAVQIARAMGAGVTGVCSTRNVDLVRSIGADDVVDHTSQDSTQLGRRFDVVLDNVGNRPANAWRRVLRRNGTYVASFGRKDHRWIGPLGQLARAAALNAVVPQRLTMLPTRWDVAELAAVGALIDAGQVRPVIDRTYPLAAAAEALAYVGEGHARGKVVVTVEES